MRQTPPHLQARTAILAGLIMLLTGFGTAAEAGSQGEGGLPTLLIVGVIFVFIGVMGNVMFFGYAFMTGSLRPADILPFMDANDTQDRKKDGKQGQTRQRSRQRGQRRQKQQRGPSRRQPSMDRLLQRTQNIIDWLDQHPPSGNRRQLLRQIDQAERHIKQDNLKEAARSIRKIEQMIRQQGRDPA